MARIMKLGYAIDNMQSKIDKKEVKGRSKRRLTKASHRLRLKIKNLITDCHSKLCKFLCESFDIILLPSFETSNMTSRKNNNKKRKINSKTVRKMLTWSHYSFKQGLVVKIKRVSPWVEVKNCE